MFESLVSRLTSPPVSRRRHTVHATREVCSEPEEEAAPVQRRSRTAKQLLDKRRKARLSCADLTAATNAEPERTSRMDAIKAFLPLRQSKSLGRLDGLKEDQVIVDERDGFCSRPLKIVCMVWSLLRN
ncbi:unnamed protein product [Pieris brassicae]|uniref:Uncharacterized protein n=1 Tax=Pieris brassicae TaxID=7116 RepID=A0A9P0TKF5_PIEBR|nr:unnamed protein product [Pieris brassicae]